MRDLNKKWKNEANQERIGRLTARKTVSICVNDQNRPVGARADWGQSGDPWHTELKWSSREARSGKVMVNHWYRMVYIHIDKNMVNHW